MAANLVKHQNQQGLTLVEVLVATTILSMVVLAVANVLITGRLANYSAKQKSVAINLAQGKMEEILAQEITSPQPPQAGSFNDMPGYKYTYYIEDYKIDANSFWAIHVTVYYDHNGKPQNEASLFTLKRKG